MISVSMVGGLIYVTSPPIASKLEGIRTLNKGVVIPFSLFFYLIKGKRVNL
jgi:hypothetical protein